MKKGRRFIRETSQHMTDAYYAPLDAFRKECETDARVRRIRTFSQDQFNDLQYVLRLFSHMSDIGLVIHGPCGCLSTLPEHIDGRRWAVTGLNANDIIMGGAEKLKKTVLHLLEKTRPSHLFILMTPPASINNDDTEAAAEELHARTGVPISVISTTGFHFKLGMTGYGEAETALFPFFTPPVQRTEKSYVNLLSVSESTRALTEWGEYINRLGFAVNILPNLAGIRQLRLASGAAASIVLNPDEGYPAADFLQQRYNVPLLAPDAPVGYDGAARWEQTVAFFLGKEVPKRDVPVPDGRLNGLRIYLECKPHEAVACQTFLESYGAEICGMSVPYLDASAPLLTQNVRNGNEAVHVGQGQNFELHNILSQVSPDLFLTQEHSFVTALRLGIPTVFLGDTGLLGRHAADCILHRIRLVRENPGFFLACSTPESSLYARMWMKKSADWHIKREVP